MINSIFTLKQLQEDTTFSKLAEAQSRFDDAQEKELANFTRSPFQLLAFLIIYAGLNQDKRQVVVKFLQKKYQVAIAGHEELNSLVNERINWGQILAPQEKSLNFKLNITLKDANAFLPEILKHCPSLYAPLLTGNYITSGGSPDEIVFATEFTQQEEWKEPWHQDGGYWSVKHFDLSNALQDKINDLAENEQWACGTFSVSKGTPGQPINVLVKRPKLASALLHQVQAKSLNELDVDSYKGQYVLLCGDGADLYYIGPNGKATIYHYDDRKIANLIQDKPIPYTHELTEEILKSCIYQLSSQYSNTLDAKVKPGIYESLIGMRDVFGLRRVDKVEVIVSGHALLSERGAQASQKQIVRGKHECWDGRVIALKPTVIYVNSNMEGLHVLFHKIAAAVCFSENSMPELRTQGRYNDAEISRHNEEKKYSISPGITGDGIGISFYPFPLSAQNVNEINKAYCISPSNKQTMELGQGEGLTINDSKLRKKDSDVKKTQSCLNPIEVNNMPCSEKRKKVVSPKANKKNDSAKKHITMDEFYSLICTSSAKECVEICRNVGKDFCTLITNEDELQSTLIVLGPNQECHEILYGVLKEKLHELINDASSFSNILLGLDPLNYQAFFKAYGKKQLKKIIDDVEAKDYGDLFSEPQQKAIKQFITRQPFVIKGSFYHSNPRAEADQAMELERNKGVASTTL